MPTTIVFPFPPSSLSGHNTGHWRKKGKTVASWRGMGHWLTKQAKIPVPPPGDVPLRMRFVPPDRRGDRQNFINRMKPAIDGIADALGINDSRFVPSVEFAPPEAPGRVEVMVG